MDRFKRIIFCLDPRAKVAPALRHVTWLARQSAAVVTVVDCVEPAPAIVKKLAPASWDLEAMIRGERQRRLDITADHLRNQGIPAEAKLLNGQPATEVTREALRGGHDLVIKTAHGEPMSKERSLFGTTAIGLMRVCPCPVWVVDPSESGRLDRILVAIDPQSDDSKHVELNEKALDLAADLAEHAGSSLYIVHAWTPYGEAVLRPRVSEESLNNYIESCRQHAEQQTAALLAKFASRISPEDAFLVRGEPEQMIPEIALRRRIDLIVMGTVGRTGLAGAIIGNTAEKVLRRVRCSVLAVKPDTFVSPLGLHDHEPPRTRHLKEPHDTCEIKSIGWRLKSEQTSERLRT